MDERTVETGAFRLTDPQRDAVVAFLTSTCVPIVRPSDRAVIATGTLFEVAGYRFFVTAAHVVRDAAKFFVAKDESGITLVDLAGSSGEANHPTGADSDCAVFHLTDRVVEELRGRRFLTLSNVSPFRPGPTATVVVSGFPTDVTRLGLDAARIFFTIPREGVESFMPDGDDLGRKPIKTVTGLHLFLHHSKHVTDLVTGVKAKGPALGGMSGSSIWTFTLTDSETVWTPDRAIKVIGIQSSYIKGEWVRGTFWHQVAGMILSMVPETRGEIERHYGSNPDDWPRAPIDSA